MMNDLPHRAVLHHSMHLMWHAGVSRGASSSGDYFPLIFLGLGHISIVLLVYLIPFFFSIKSVSIDFVIDFQVLVQFMVRILV